MSLRYSQKRKVLLSPVCVHVHVSMCTCIVYVYACMVLCPYFNKCTLLFGPLGLLFIRLHHDY
jgi:hypothetical protein